MLSRKILKSLIIAAIACYAFMAYPEHNKNIDPGLWKPEEKQEKPEHKLITGLFFFLLGMALLIKSCSVEPALVDVLQLSGLLTTVAGIVLMVAYVVSKKALTPV